MFSITAGPVDPGSAGTKVSCPVSLFVVDVNTLGCDVYTNSGLFGRPPSFVCGGDVISLRIVVSNNACMFVFILLVSCFPVSNR